MTKTGKLAFLIRCYYFKFYFFRNSKIPAPVIRSKPPKIQCNVFSPVAGEYFDKVCRIGLGAGCTNVTFFFVTVTCLLVGEAVGEAVICVLLGAGVTDGVGAVVAVGIGLSGTVGVKAGVIVGVVDGVVVGVVAGLTVGVGFIVGVIDGVAVGVGVGLTVGVGVGDGFIVGVGVGFHVGVGVGLIVGVALGLGGVTS